MKKISYLKTITSLRGVSVLGVLLYHSKYSLFQTGYLGVDVFFVISGFLIGNIIFSKLHNNEFSFTNFYIRRLRRLLPSLIFTIVFTTIIFYFLFLQEDFQLLIYSVPYTLLFVGNIFFWRTNDYFSPSTDIMPLSHLWSLAIEEQFYLLFPLVIFIIFKLELFRKNIKLIILFGILLSFTYTIFGFYNLPFECPTTNCVEVTNFYWLHTRAWELLTGVSLNFIKVKKSIFNKSSFYIGLLIVITSFIYMPSSFTHPGIGTLSTVFGTILIILSSLNNDNNILSRSSSMYFIGKISYSLYLIHFPLFVIRNYFELNLNLFQIFDILPILITTLSIFIGYFMWKYIETPFRNYKFITNSNFLKTLFFFIFSILIITNYSIIPEKKLNSEYKKFNFTTDFIKQECFFEFIPDNLLEIDLCLDPQDNKKNVLVIGSSLAHNIYTGVSKTTNDYIHYDVVTVTGCPPLVEKYEFDIADFSEEKCEVIYSQINKNLIQKKYSKIILIYQWRDLIENQINNDLSLFDYTLNKILTKLPKEKILIVGEPVRWNVRLDIFANRELNTRGKVEEFTTSNFDSGIFNTEEIFKQKMTEFQIDSYSLIDLLCENSKCLTYQKVEEIYYFVSGDLLHISNHFTQKIGQDIFSKLNESD